MRTNCRLGDIYRVPIENDSVRFFHFIAKDSTDLNSDVIRIFKRHYHSDDSPSINDILNDEVECHMHTFLRLGIKMGLWEKYSFHAIATEEIIDIAFRESCDFGNYPGQKIVSKNWEIWHINKPRIKVGELPVAYQKADIGLVFSPHSVMKRLNGKELYVLYPTY